jgi:hypothetical protein
MPNLILTYTLKPGVAKDDFEAWVRDVDYPAMRGLARVTSFTTYRTEKLLVGEGAPPCDYVELFAIEDMAGFTAEDMPGDTVQRIMGEFFQHVENPAFMIVSEVK